MSLDRPTFPQARFLETYDIEEVDLAVEMILENLALPRPRIDRADVLQLRFTPVRLRPGYEMAPVDEWLDEVVAELARRSGDQPVTAPTQTAPAQDVPTGSDVPARPTYAPTTSQAIVEVPRSSHRGLVLLAILVVVAVVLYVSLA